MNNLQAQVLLGTLLAAVTRLGSCGHLTATKVTSFDTAQPAFNIALSPDRQFVAVTSWGANSGIDIHEVRPHRIVTHIDASNPILGHQQLDYTYAGDRLAVCNTNSVMIYDTTRWARKTIDSTCDGLSFTADGRQIAVVREVTKDQIDKADFEYYDVDCRISRVWTPLIS